MSLKIYLDKRKNKHGEAPVVIYKRLKGLSSKGKGEEGNICVPLVEEIGNHLCAKIKRIFFVGRGDILNSAFFIAWDLCSDFFHFSLFFGKGRGNFCQNQAD